MILSIVALLLTSCQVTEPNVSNVSKTESEINSGNTSEITSVIESNPNSDISEIDEVSEVSEEPVDMPVGVSEVDGKYYLNLEGGNDYIPGKDPVVEGGDISFKDIKDFKEKIQSLNFTDEEFLIMKRFQKDKYGIKFLNHETIYSPVGIVSDLSFVDIRYLGFETYTFWFTGEGKYINFQHQHRDTLNEFKNIFANDMESLELNPELKAVKSKETLNGLEKTVLKYQNSMGADVIKKTFTYEVNGTKYTVYEHYVADKNDPEYNLEVPKYFNLCAEHADYCFGMEAVGFAPDVEFLSGLGMELVK
ncbi:MAG: hypothetical protein PHV95_02905 [Eubacteriales bacterium]|nr:hypothetical protein [Eubacteriales bacterium]